MYYGFCVDNLSMLIDRPYRMSCKNCLVWCRFPYFIFYFIRQFRNAMFIHYLCWSIIGKIYSMNVYVIDVFAHHYGFAFGSYFLQNLCPSNNMSVNPLFLCSCSFFRWFDNVFCCIDWLIVIWSIHLSRMSLVPCVSFSNMRDEVIDSFVGVWWMNFSLVNVSFHNSMSIVHVFGCFISYMFSLVSFDFALYCLRLMCSSVNGSSKENRGQRQSCYVPFLIVWFSKHNGPLHTRCAYKQDRQELYQGFPPILPYDV